jgi:hypothetical protein
MSNVASQKCLVQALGLLQFEQAWKWLLL